MTKKPKFYKSDVMSVLNLNVSEIVSTGHPGVEYAALIAGFKHSNTQLEIGGFIPLDYRTKKGPMPELKRFGIKPLKNRAYEAAIEANVKKTDVVMTLFEDQSDTDWTYYVSDMAQKHKKIYMYYGNPDLIQISNAFIFNMGYLVNNRYSREEYNRIQKEGLKVYFTGPREHKRPGVQKTSREFFIKLLEKISIEPYRSPK